MKKAIAIVFALAALAVPAASAGVVLGDNAEAGASTGILLMD